MSHRFALNRGPVYLKISYPFFTGMALLLAIETIYHLLLIPASLGATLLFVGLAVLELVLELLLLLLVVTFLVPLLPGKRSSCLASWLTSLVLLLLMIHAADLILVRLMDLSFWQALMIAFEESLGNLLEILYASNLSPLLYAAGALGMVALFVIILLLHKRMEGKRLIAVRLEPLWRAGLFLSLLLPLFGLLLKRLPEAEVGLLAEATPWRWQPFAAKGAAIALPSSWRAASATSLQKWPARELQVRQAEQLPDLFLFICESLREEFLDEASAPHLATLRKKAIWPKRSYAGANATHLSWMSLFFSQPATEWEAIHGDETRWGAPPLRWLKTVGYQIHLLTSSRQSYYKMDELLFGKKQSLLSSYHNFSATNPSDLWRADKSIFEELGEWITKEKSGGRLFLIFLDSTHFPYSWPQEESRFLPVAPGIQLLYHLLIRHPNLNGLTNRYRNAISHIDKLFGQFYHLLEERKLLDRSLLLFTGDHGEEFFEFGHLFHASTLNHCQLRVPLYLWGAGSSRPSLASHIDLFPTILSLVAEEEMPPPLAGRSLLASGEGRVALSGRFNGCRSPKQMVLQTEEGELLLDLKEGSIRASLLNTTLDTPFPLRLLMPALDSMQISPDHNR